MQLVKKTRVADYRDVEKLSYSSLKTFINNKLGYYKEFILREPVERKESFAMDFGNLVDCMLFDYDNLNNLYAVSSGVEPVGQMMDLTKELYRKTLIYSQDGQLTKDFKLILEEAYQSVAFDSAGKAVAFKGKSFDKVCGMFFGSDAESYYDELRRNTGKTVINLGMMTNAEETVDLLRNNFVTGHLFQERVNVDIYEQEPIEFEIFNEQMKCLPDHFEVHHDKKLIIPYDLKCTWEVLTFPYNYIKNRYDIQNAVYVLGLQEWKKVHNLQDYQVLPMTFITVDSTGSTNPLLWKTTGEDVDRAINGYSINGKKYMGIKEAIEDLQWSRETDIWNMRQDAYVKNGIIDINVQYD